FVLYLLSNPLYIGKLRYSANGRAVSQRSRNSGDIVVVDGNHPPIIDMDTWDKTQARLAEIRARYPKYAKPDAPPAPFALRGVFRCGDCGATLVRVHTKKPSLQCHCYSRGTCKRSHSILIERAEAALLDALSDAAASSMIQASSVSTIEKDSPEEQ
ncbi:MAG: recombinase family protein, partial [Alistipes sp.]|nr:recombinase family protein [Alistipes sp.]